MSEEIILALVGVLFGWLLSQLTEIVKSHLNKRSKIKAIWVEMDDIRAWLHRMSLTLEENIELILLGERVRSIPAELRTFIIDEHFHSVCAELPREARVGIVDTYNRVKNINRLNEGLYEVVQKQASVSVEKHLNETEDVLVNVYHALFTAKFLVENPSGDYKLLNEKAASLEHDIHDRLTSIRDKAMVKKELINA